MDKILWTIEVLLLMALSLAVHECCHALAAHMLGDDTAKWEGRLTLNPLVHLDLWGSILIPGLAALMGWPLIGYAKPTPVNPVNFTTKISMRTGMLITAAAGPFANLILAFVSGFGLWVMMKTGFAPEVLQVFFLGLLQINIVLMIFNLLPIPPLDGAMVLRGIVPYRYLNWFDYVITHPYYVIPAFVALLFLGARPFGHLVRGIMNLILGIYGIGGL